MVRRIVLTMLALIGALLVTTVVPLGLITTGHERSSFREDTTLSARALAGFAEDRLADRPHGGTLARSLAQAQRAGEQVRLYDAERRVVTGTSGRDLAIPAATLTAALHGRTIVGTGTDDRLQVIVPVLGDRGVAVVGAVVLSRSAAELEERVGVLWTWLATVGAAGLAAAAVAAIALARWVSRPLSALDEAAQRLGSGALDTRSAAGHGPPEVSRLARNFNTMAGRLESLVHGNRATMADVSHQLRTPLAALRLRLDVLTQDADPATAEELAGAQGEIARLSHLVDGLLAVARAENVVVDPVSVRVDEVIRDRVVAWRPVAEERGVELRQSCPDPVPALAGEGHLEQVLDNLLANALDAVPAGGHVVISAVADGDAARVVVADDGPGMSARQQEMAFRRFVSSTPGGAGLGLAIVHRLVTSNGGSTALSDTPGGGLTVTVDLLAAQPDRARRPGGASD
ncbi:MAG TPA: HAMP domain-containing sensor histidine kinase [Streptosporangiaceae bacterium]|nr:HAMP domain-containing sensor histidine kinase [Streptosporangiaceae bacterium]